MSRGIAKQCRETPSRQSCEQTRPHTRLSRIWEIGDVTHDATNPVKLSRVLRDAVEWIRVYVLVLVLRYQRLAHRLSVIGETGGGLRV
jgi:hypothetical protein